MKKEPTEHSEQVAVIQWCETMKNQYPALDLIFAIPNGGKRHVGTAKKLKAEGVKAGVPDLFLPVPRWVEYLERKFKAGLFIEMKIKGRKTTPNQNKWIADLRRQGYRVEVCQGADAAIEVIKEYLGIFERGLTPNLIAIRPLN